MTCGIFAALVSVFLLVLALSMRTGISALQKNTKEGKSRRVAHARCESIVICRCGRPPISRPSLLEAKRSWSFKNAMALFEEFGQC
jgi:hypothetical protein